jgi:protein dedA
MTKGKFMFYNIIGAIAWSFSLVFMGHYLDKLFIEQFGIDLKKHLEYIVLFIVLITTAPILIKLLMPSKKSE